ncbi:uncharacterized protein LOC118190660 [Stegodyphus dumicola]|uniref:uncharacterized protein LOC118190660 n=1 Tax=Stegodyphus dumicola TaxID=202533 RepID=UPI0015B082B1|nr:uncharacterized protein LOC118190660 [Stegodyphus dumicola]
MSILLTSNYTPPTADIEPTTRFLNRIMQQFRMPDKIFAGDFNSHNTAWGYRATDFFRTRRMHRQLLIDHSQRGWPDLTLTTPHTALYLQNWKVEEDESLSDHKFITFSLEKQTIVSKIRRYNLPGRKIKTFSKKIKDQLTHLDQTLQQLTTTSELEEFTIKLQTVIQNTCNECLPLRKPKKLQGLNWWSSTLRTKQSKCRALRRRLKNERRLGIQSNTLTVFRQERAAYKRMIIQAKIASWRDFCTQTKEVYGIHHKIATAKIFKPSQLQVPSTQTTVESHTADTIRAILNTVFCQDDAQLDTELQANIRSDTTIPETDADRNITIAELKHIIHNLPKKKAPGPDGVDYNSQNNNPSSPNVFCSLLQQTVTYGYLPKAI